ncbi:MAG: hypothetical protein NVSMB9_30200 [Isosphaeraceae bacterium]
MLRNVLTAGLAILAFTPALQALDEPPETKTTARQRYEALFQEHQKAMQSFSDAYQKAKTEEEKAKIGNTYPDVRLYTGRFMAIADADPGDPAAVDALIWVVGHAGGVPDVARAIDRLASKHADNRRLAEITPTLGYSQSPSAETLLRAILAKNPDRDAKGKACLALAQYLKRQSETIRAINDDPRQARQMEEFYAGQGISREKFEKLAQRDPEAMTSEAEAAFDRVVREFSDVKGGRETIGKAAKAELYELRNLAVGKPAPEIAGEDIDGKAFKLSDYKGKVVVVDFWGDW